MERTAPAYHMLLLGGIPSEPEAETRHGLSRTGDTMAHADDEKVEEETRLETHIRARLGSRVLHLRVVFGANGVILQGSTHTYYAKQLAQQSVGEMSNLPVLANEIEVR